MDDRNDGYRVAVLCACLFAACVLSPGETRAQAGAKSPSSTHVDEQAAEDRRYSMMLRGVPIEPALEKLVDITQINLAYASELVGNTRVFCSARSVTVNELLGCILEDARLDFYVTSTGTYVLTAAPEKQPRQGRLAGVVVDASTGDPLPYANILLADAGVGTAANDEGIFALAPLVAGAHRLIVTYVGFETRVDSIWIAPGGSAKRRIELKAQSVATGPVVVNGLQQRLPSQELGRAAASQLELAEVSSVGTPDVARSAGGLMGVGQQEPMAELHIQGGGGGEHQVRLDGVPIRNPVTLGRLLGAFSPLAIERLDVHKAGFGVEYGSRLSGVVDAAHSLAPDGSVMTVQADALSINGRVQGAFTLPEGKEVTTMGAFRKSVWDVFSYPMLEQLITSWHVVDPLLVPAATGGNASGANPGDRTAIVDFSDYHGAARLRLSPLESIHVSLYRGHNMIDSRADIAGTADASQDRYHWTNWSGQARYSWMPGARTLGRVRLYASRQSIGHGYEMPSSYGDSSAAALDYPYDGNRLYEAGLEGRMEMSLTSRHHLTGGLRVRRIGSRAVIENHFFEPLAYDHGAWQLSGSIKDELSLGFGTTLEAGTRLTYIFERQTLYAEPRAALRYDGLHPGIGAYAFKVAGGMYRQFVNRYDLGSTGPTAVVPSLRIWLPVDRSLAPPRAYHLAAEALWKPSERWKINAESYYKHQARLLAINYPALISSGGVSSSGAASPAIELQQSAFIAPTSGFAAGGGIRIRRQGPQWTGTLSYEHSHVRRHFPGRFNERSMPPPWSQPHQLSADGSYRLLNGLDVRMRWTGAWGRSWGFRRAYYDYLAPQSETGEYAPFDLGDPASHALPPFYRMDAGLMWRPDWQRLDAGFRAEVVNLFDRQNELDWTLRTTDSGYERFARTLPGRHVIISVRLSF